MRLRGTLPSGKNWRQAASDPGILPEAASWRFLSDPIKYMTDWLLYKTSLLRFKRVRMSIQ